MSGTPLALQAQRDRMGNADGGAAPVVGGSGGGGGGGGGAGDEDGGSGGGGAGAATLAESWINFLTRITGASFAVARCVRRYVLMRVWWGGGVLTCARNRGGGWVVAGMAGVSEAKANT